MTSFLSRLMSPQDYMPHGMCFLWQPELIALHVASDSAIAANIQRLNGIDSCIFSRRLTSTKAIGPFSFG